MKIRLNTILIALASAVLIVFFFADKTGSYLRGSQPEVYLLILITLVSLFINRRVKNEFLEILNLLFVIFYICRIPFVLSAGVFSDVISRHVPAGKIPGALALLAFQYFSLVLCILIVNPKIPRWKMRLPSKAIFKKILLFSFVIILINCAYTFLTWSYYGGPSLGHILSILQTVFTPKDAVMLLLLGWIASGNVGLKYKFAILSLCALEVISTIYIGDKSGLPELMLLAYLTTVAVSGPFVFRTRSLLVTLILGIISFLLFPAGSTFRNYQRGLIRSDQVLDNSLDSIYPQSSSQESVAGQTRNPSSPRRAAISARLSRAINSFSYRVGFLDFYIDKVTNPVYGPYVSFNYYFMSLTDKLTPGFDVFHVPFASRALYSAYNGKSSVGTNSDQVTLFAESQLLLGFFSFTLYLSYLS